MSGTLTFTPQQQAAIDTRGSALLVAAAAGSGKTRVLVERLMAYLTDPEKPASITDFLIITYTKAAAAELRGRISDTIARRLTAEPQNRALRRQLNLCACAEIGTIHSFCTRVIRENAHLLGLAPDFRVGEERECALLKERALDAVLEKQYAQIAAEPEFACLVDTMSAGRDDRRLTEIVLDIHARLQSFPYPEKWIDSQLRALALDGVTDAGETVWGAYLLERAGRDAGYWLRSVDALLDEARAESAFYEKYGAAMETLRERIAAFAAAAARGWDAAAACTFDCPKARPVKGYDDLKERFKKCKAGIAKTAAVFDCPSAAALDGLRQTAPAVRALLRLVPAFDRAYAAEKKRRGLVDFADLEHFAVRLLTDAQTGAPTALAREISRRYTEIMVDEYQDVNEVQDALFHAVSRDGRNVFMVGDVKQSIYRFRLADPAIFLDKYSRYREKQDEDTGRCIVLSRNFRSRVGVLDSVNFMFRNTMSVQFGEMDYTPEEYLYPGAAYPPAQEPETELDIVDLSGSETDGETPDKVRAEAAFIAGRIVQLQNTLRLADGNGGTRPAHWGDFAILMRALKDKLPVYVRALQERGVPVSVDKGSRFFDTAEISGLVSLLTIIDNPRQDVPLIAALRSPLFGFTPDELGKIRLCAPKADFYTALTAAGEADEKCRAFLAQLARFRAAAEDMPADRLIWHIYNETGAPGVYGALTGGAARRENLMQLAETAQTFEQNGYKGLYAFITYLRQVMERGDTPADAPAPQNVDAVRLTTIHRSKGLEYPVVFVAGLAQKFNKMDVRKPLLFHPALGVGPKTLDRGLGAQMPTIARDAVAARGQSEMLAEELRVLYVAMTRAREKLVLTCAWPQAEKKLEKLRTDAAAPVPPQVLESAQSMAEWVLLAALTRPEAARLTDAEKDVPLPDGSWQMHIVRPGDDMERTAAAPAAAQAPETVDGGLADAVLERLRFRYAHEGAVALPSKLTATELKGRAADQEAADGAQQAFVRPEGEYRRPDFAPERRLSAAERGTAVHLALQLIDPEAAAHTGVRAALDTLFRQGEITRRQYDAVNPAMLERFYASEIGRRVRRAAWIRREFKFSVLADADVFLQGGTGEQVLLQGVVDCCFEEDGGLVLLDFKTDFVRPGEARMAAARYAPQMDAYAYALEKMTGRPVREKTLFFLRTGETVTLGRTDEKDEKN